MPKILFVCTANRFRSILAEEFFNRELRTNGNASDWEVTSAGTWVTIPMAPTKEAYVEAQKRGLFLGQRLSKSIESLQVSSFDLIVVMEKGHKEALMTEFPKLKEKIFLLSELGGNIGYSIPDPYISGESTISIAAEIDEKIKENLMRYVGLA
jgi:protein-tyrosine phosphatase